MTPDQREAVWLCIDMNPRLSTNALTYLIRFKCGVDLTHKQIEAIRARAGGHGRTPKSRMDSLTVPKE